MLDLGTSFVASVARDPDALAVVDDGIRLTYAQWYARISSLVAAFDRIGLKPGDHSSRRFRIARPPPRCTGPASLPGIVITPINWRAKDDELDFCIENSESCAVVYQDVSAQAVEKSKRAPALATIYVGGDDAAGNFDFHRMVAERAA